MVPIACMPSPIPRQVCWNLFAHTIPLASAFPEIGAGRHLHNVFEACSAFTHVTACMLTESPMRPSTPKASAASLPPPLLRLLPGGANESKIEIREPLQQIRRGVVNLRPVKLNVLASLLTLRGSSQVERNKKAYAQWLAFGDSVAP